MGTPAQDPRVHKITIRLSEKEYVAMRTQMECNDYRSQSRFIRDRILGARVVVQKDVVLTDRALRNQINVLSATVAKIGVDYNQATRTFNTLFKQKREDGSPVINARAANYYLQKVNGFTRELKAAVDKVIELVAGLQKESGPHGEDCGNN